MTTIYRGMSQQALDDAYDNRKAVPDHARYRAEREPRSQAVYARYKVDRDERYGSGARQRLDFVHCGRPDRPTLAFIHGGYWQWNDKEPHAFVGAGLLERGVNFVNVEYTLAPAARMTDIVNEIQTCMRWLAPRLASRYGASDRLVVSGHSAGGHLTAIACEVPGVHAGVAISGLFDLEPIRLCYLNEPIRMTADEARQNSPMARTPGAAKCVVAVGGAELPELVRQSREYADYLRRHGRATTLLEFHGDNHFSVLESLARADGVLAQTVLELAGVAA